MPRPGDPSKPTIVDVARRAGVSKGLVSLALNERPGVSVRSRERISSAARELGWSPSIRARALSSARSYAVGLVLARDPALVAADPFFPALIAGIESELGRRGMVLTLAMVDDGSDGHDTYRALARDGRVDGVFLSDLRTADPRFALLDELDIPAVTLGRPDVPCRHPAVSVDDTAGIRAAVEHLVALGHRRIAHVAGCAEMLHGARRRATFDATLAAAGLEPAGIVDTDFTAAAGARATGLLLASARPPTAIVYANDPMAIAGIGVAVSRGLVVPADLSVTGFDGMEIGRWITPALTTVTTDVAGWGAAAARVLLDRIEDRTTPDVDLAPARLEVRGSTAQARRRRGPS